MKGEANDTIHSTNTLFDMPICSSIDELAADVAVIGVPFDFGSGQVSRAGTKFAPKVMRQPRNTFSYTGSGEAEPACGWFDSDTGTWKLRGITMADCGDVNIPPTDSNRSFDRITRTVSRILERKALPVVIGGDHTITFPVMKAFDRYDSLDIVHFDAHLDFEDEFDGVRISYSSPLRRCSELPFVHGITQIGLRGPLAPSREKSYRAALEYGEKFITTKKFKQMGVSKVVESIPQADNIYVSLDVDVFDPSVAPGVTSLAPGGLSFPEVRDTLIGIAGKGRVVGFDIVCLSPINDCSDMTFRMVADIIVYFLSAVFPSRS